MFMAMLGFYFLVTTHCSQSSQEDIYYIDQEFDQVRKVLSRKNSLEEIVASQHGEVLHQEWHNLDVSADRLLGPWDINGFGEFIIKSNDPELGTFVLRFNQTVSISKDTLVSKSSLAEPSGDLKEYNTEMTMTRDGEKTKVACRTSLKYERKIPVNYIDYMDQQVDKAVAEGLRTNQEAILSLMDKNPGKRFVLPIKRRKKI